MASTDLLYRFIAKDVNVADTFNVLADCAADIAVALRKAANALTDAQVSEDIPASPAV